MLSLPPDTATPFFLARKLEIFLPTCDRNTSGTSLLRTLLNSARGTALLAAAAAPKAPCIARQGIVRIEEELSRFATPILACACKAIKGISNKDLRILNEVSLRYGDISPCGIIALSQNSTTSTSPRNPKTRKKKIRKNNLPFQPNTTRNRASKTLCLPRPIQT